MLVSTKQCDRRPRCSLWSILFAIIYNKQNSISFENKTLWDMPRHCSLTQSYIQCLKLTKQYTFSHISPTIVLMSHVTLVKYTGLVSFVHWMQICVFFMARLDLCFYLFTCIRASCIRLQRLVHSTHHHRSSPKHSGKEFQLVHLAP